MGPVAETSETAVLSKVQPDVHLSSQVQSQVRGVFRSRGTVEVPGAWDLSLGTGDTPGVWDFLLPGTGEVPGAWALSLGTGETHGVWDFSSRRHLGSGV